jgi:hypothetical protein
MDPQAVSENHRRALFRGPQKHTFRQYFQFQDCSHGNAYLLPYLAW